MTTVEKINAFAHSHLPWWDVEGKATTADLRSKKSRRAIYEFFRDIADDNVDNDPVFYAAVDIIVDIIDLERRTS